MRWLLRFFHAADPMPPWMLMISICISVYAVLIAAVDPRGVDEALAILLLWQMLSASSGFARAATAGHFDPALVMFDRRLIAAIHAFHAVWPVALAWASVAVVDPLFHDLEPRALEPGRLSAFLFVSLTCWAASLAGPRLVAGVLWLVAIVALVTTHVGPEQYASMLSRSDGSLTQYVHAAALVLACPFLMLGDHIPPRDAAIAALLTASSASGLGGLWFIARRNFPLEPSS